MSNTSDIHNYETSPDSKYEWALNALDVLASVRTFQDIVNKQNAKEELYNAAGAFINQLVPMECIAFMEVSEADMSFVLVDCKPEDKTNYVQQIIDEQIENGTFAWVIQQNKITTIALDEQNQNIDRSNKQNNGQGNETEKEQDKEKTLLLNALVTPLGVKGMFVGILDSTLESVQGIGIDTVSVVVQNLASSLDTYFSKQLINNYNQQLEVVIKYRTRELEEAKKLAEVANIAKSDFLASMSHELNTPFNIIFGYLDLMMEDLEGIKKEDPRYTMRDDLIKISLATKNLNKMVTNIIYLAKLEAGRLVADISEFELEEMLSKISQSYSERIKQNNNVLALNINTDHVLIEHDQQLVERAIDHLLDNACKFTKNGTIKLEVVDREMDGQAFILISINDTGIGIADDDIKLLCSSFTQVDSSDRRQFEGLGLGLAITKRICSLIGASMKVESKLGEGSKFSICLPVNPNYEKPLEMP